MKGRVNSWLNRGKLILQEWEVKIQRLEIWLLVLKVMTQRQELFAFSSIFKSSCEQQDVDDDDDNCEKQR